MILPDVNILVYAYRGDAVITFFTSIGLRALSLAASPTVLATMC